MSDVEVIFVKKGESWNVSCETASSYPMKWVFDGFEPWNKSIILYSKWIQNEKYFHR